MQWLINDTHIYLNHWSSERTPPHAAPLSMQEHRGRPPWNESSSEAKRQGTWHLAHSDLAPPNCLVIDNHFGICMCFSLQIPYRWGSCMQLFIDLGRSTHPTSYSISFDIQIWIYYIFWTKSLIYISFVYSRFLLWGFQTRSILNMFWRVFKRSLTFGTSKWRKHKVQKLQLKIWCALMWNAQHSGSRAKSDGRVSKLYKFSKFQKLKT